MLLRSWCRHQPSYQILWTLQVYATSTSYSLHTKSTQPPHHILCTLKVYATSISDSLHTKILRNIAPTQTSLLPSTLHFPSLLSNRPSVVVYLLAFVFCSFQLHLHYNTAYSSSSVLSVSLFQSSSTHLCIFYLARTISTAITSK